MNLDMVYAVVIQEYNDSGEASELSIRLFRREEDAQNYSDSFMLDNNDGYKVKEINDFVVTMADCEGKKRITIKNYEFEVN